jgi:hypothetical protein
LGSKTKFVSGLELANKTWDLRWQDSIDWLTGLVLVDCWRDDVKVELIIFEKSIFLTV